MPVFTLPGVARALALAPVFALSLASAHTGGNAIGALEIRDGYFFDPGTAAVQVHFDPAVLTYDDVLEVFWRQINPTDAGGQFVDRGTQYRSEIFYHDEEQRRIAEASKARLARSGRFSDPIVTWSGARFSKQLLV